MSPRSRSDEDPPSRREKLGAVAPTARRQLDLAVHWPRYRTGWRRVQPATGPDLGAMPPTAWVEAATEASAHLMSAAFVDHGHRTWYFGTRLAEVEGADVDPELLAVAALLHDVGLFRPPPGQSFPAGGAAMAIATAQTAGVAPDRAALVEAAIIGHVRPYPPSDSLGKYLQDGSMLDVTGHGVWRLPRAEVVAAVQKWRRTGFPGELRAHWSAECRRVPRGWAAWARRPGGLLLASRFPTLPAAGATGCGRRGGQRPHAS